MDAEGHLLRTERLDRVGQLDLPALDLHADVRERFLDVLRGDRTPHTILLARGSLDLDRDGAELRLELLRLRDFFLRLLLGKALELYHPSEVPGGGRDREPA